MLCVGTTEEGQKQVPGFVETTTENAEAITGLLQDLIERGLLCVIDGAKGLRKAIQDVIGPYGARGTSRRTWRTSSPKRGSGACTPKHARGLPQGHVRGH